MYKHIPYSDVELMRVKFIDESRPKFKGEGLLNSHYILDKQGNPILATLGEWGVWFENFDRRRIAKTEIEKDGENITVSTVFLGIDHSFGGTVPLVFESLIQGGELDDLMVRYHFYGEALQNHYHQVQCIELGLEPIHYVLAEWLV